MELSNNGMYAFMDSVQPETLQKVEQIVKDNYLNTRITNYQRFEDCDSDEEISVYGVFGSHKFKISLDYKYPRPSIYFDEMTHKYVENQKVLSFRCLRVCHGCKGECRRMTIDCSYTISNPRSIMFFLVPIVNEVISTMQNNQDYFDFEKIKFN